MAEQAPGLRLHQVSFAYGSRGILDRISLEVASGSFFALLGASGSGKTTFLKLIAGYLKADQGRFFLSGRDVTALPPEHRQIGMVFQSYALFPHLTARGNVSFGLEVRGIPQAERSRRVEQALERVALPPEVWDRKPAALSGGQQQRVALARALVIEPDLLLLDEPLSNLDRRLREQVRGELRELQRRTGVTTLLVTHDPEEALALADCIGVMAAGRLLQVGPPQEVYERPLCPYVARLLGEANLLQVEHRDTNGLILTGGLHLPASGPLLHQASVGDTLLIRPSGIRLGESLSGINMRGKVAQISYQGAQTMLTLDLGGYPLLVCLWGQPVPRLGDSVPVHLSEEACHRLPQQDPLPLHH